MGTIIALRNAESASFLPLVPKKSSATGRDRSLQLQRGSDLQYLFALRNLQLILALSANVDCKAHARVALSSVFGFCPIFGAPLELARRHGARVA